ncbi:hypothetical protein MSAN_00772600 [Mycena sanguinolenta]|uniref:Uncharacterized protein n=1 Tax=Mycena sanguinolenta TaxID=230812 RepID=A0A8H7DEF2_9AGAR|nr:hypothetical protein MSAN_00772600 [Mycena sanguinolenta]
MNRRGACRLGAPFGGRESMHGSFAGEIYARLHKFETRWALLRSPIAGWTTCRYAPESVYALLDCGLCWTTKRYRSALQGWRKLLSFLFILDIVQASTLSDLPNNLHRRPHPRDVLPSVPVSHGFDGGSVRRDLRNGG